MPVTNYILNQLRTNTVNNNYENLITTRVIHDIHVVQLFYRFEYPTYLTLPLEIVKQL